MSYIYFDKSLHTQENIGELITFLYNKTTIFGSWNFDKNSDNHQPDINDIELGMRNYLEHCNYSEIYHLCIVCMESFITAPFYFEKLVHIIRTVHASYHDFRVVYTIAREGRELKLEFYIIPLELSTGNIYEFSDDHCDKINKLSDEILRSRKQEKSAALINKR